MHRPEQKSVVGNSTNQLEVEENLFASDFAVRVLRVCTAPNEKSDAGNSTNKL